MNAILKAYLVDDEHLALKRLTRLLNATKRVEVVSSTTDPEIALEFLNQQNIDLLFLDIHMPGMNGFELLAKLIQQPLVIFTTAYDQYALQAFEVNSIDYLLKPIETAQLDRALDKIERIYQINHTHNQFNNPPFNQQANSQINNNQNVAQPLQTQLQILAKQLAASLNQSTPQFLERIPSKVGDLIQLIDINQITHFFAEDKLTYAATINKSYVIDYTIADLEQRLDPKKFLRIHRSTIVSLAAILELDTGFVIRLKDAKKTELIVARDRVRILKERLGL